VSLSVAIRSRVGGFELNVEYQAPPGITALFGPSGAGKTVTLRCIAGLVRPGAGRIVVDGRVLFDHAAGVDLPARNRRIGYVFQQYALFPHLDVARNIAYGLNDWPAGARGARVADLLRLVGLEGYGERRPRDLSGGEQQRVALARALAPRPDLLLLDEPFAALDTRVRRRLRAELRRIHQETAVPMVLVTHDLVEVRQLSDWVVLYERGRVLRAGPTPAILADPGSPEASALLFGDEA
jgi:molybdate transport system ATP-binding protein